MKNRKTERELLGQISRLKGQLAKERRRNQKLEAENERLRERLKWQRQQKWGRRSERMAPRKKAEKKRPIKLTKIAASGPRQRKGPKRFDPKLPRVVLKVDDPSAAERTCPDTGQPMQPAKTEAIEVLACVPAYYYVARYERTLWVSPAKCAPVYSPWPDEVFGPSRAHASLLAHIAAERFGLHQPYHRLEKHAQRRGAHLARSYQVSLMKLLDKTVTRLVAEIKAEVMRHRYLHVDATPVPACDPAQPGQTSETTIWTFQAHGGPVWYQHEHDHGKSPRHPDKTLREANFAGKVQADGAAGLNQIGQRGKVTAYGCAAHCRRPFYRAYDAGELQAAPYLTGINRLFRIDRLASHFRLSRGSKEKLRKKYSLPLFRALVARARRERPKVAPNLLLGQAIGYLLKQRIYLERCIKDPEADLSNNAAERSIRGLKIGARNWLHLGHPSGGPRLANLFTLIQNCLDEGVDPERYLADILPRLPGHSAGRVAELLPRAWKKAQEQARTGQSAAA